MSFGGGAAGPALGPSPVRRAAGPPAAPSGSRSVARALGLTAAVTAGALVACGDRGEPSAASPADLLAARTAGLTALQQDRLDEAAEEFGRLASLAPDEAAGHAGLALVRLRAGELEEAEASIRLALAIEPERADHLLALAAIQSEAGRPDAARATLERALAADSGEARALWGLADLAETAEARVERLRRLVDRAPANLAARLALADALLAAAAGGGPAAEAAEAAAQLESLRQQAPDFPPVALEPFLAAVDAARAGRATEAARRLGDFRDYFEVTAPYQASLEELEGPAGPAAGIARLAFSHELTLQIQEQDAVLAALRYADATTIAGLAEAVSAAAPVGALAVGDIDGDGDEDLYLGGVAGPGGRLLRSDLGRFVDVSGAAGIPPAAGARHAAFGDVDNDGRLDLAVVGERVTLVRNADGAFAAFELPGAAEAPGRRVLFVDFDLDGDLDLLVVGPGPHRLFRNAGDGTFDERATAAGLVTAGDGPGPGADEGAAGRDGAGTSDESGPAGEDGVDVAFADFDDDRDPDLAVLGADGRLALYSNRRGGRFEEVAAMWDPGPAWGTDAAPLGEPGGALAAGDVDNDGRIDLFAAGPAGAGASLFRNVGEGRFERDARSDAAWRSLADLAARDAFFVDFDNDGHLDLFVTGRGAGAEGAGVRLFRNQGDGRFAHAGRFLPSEPPRVARAAQPADYNEDGDLDLFLVDGDGRPRLLRNDGGNANHYLRLRLVGLGQGSAKNNRFGIGARVELRAGDLLQVRTARRPLVHFGLDGRLKADVVRVEWPNGVAQDLYFPGTDQDLVEEQTLKGSCPFLYAWDGERYRFVKDVMWRSAIGMPLGILGGGSGEGRERRAHAPPGPSQEYIRLPDGLPAEKDGALSLQLTEELWETVYVDEAKLVAVDHPASFEVRVDETFVPPAPASLRLYRVEEPHTPVAAWSGPAGEWPGPRRARGGASGEVAVGQAEAAVGRGEAGGRDGVPPDPGTDALDALRAPDFRFVDDLRPGPWQGVAELHDLVLDLGPAAREGPVTLFLRGWVFPTDASVNVAMAQSDAHRPVFPFLEVRDEDGEWTRALELGIPSGKDKSVVAELAGLFPTDDRHVRIRTNAMVYWDHAYFTVGPNEPPPGETRVTTLAPRADLHYRGFSREYRRGGPWGPHWFDYEDVSTEPRWDDLDGWYTRYGDVSELLRAGDDRYVIANAGDEITLAFDPDELPPLPEGWTRTFLLYTDGWVKDGDLNTATGSTVEPLPFRDATRYPYGPGWGSDESFPDTEAHRRWREEYNTRRVDSDDF